MYSSYGQYTIPHGKMQEGKLGKMRFLRKIVRKTAEMNAASHLAIFFEESVFGKRIFYSK